MADIMAYWDFDSQRDAPRTCPSCGWTGLPDAHLDGREDLLEACCPECGLMILVVPMPTFAQTRAAAAAGNQRAAAELPEMEAYIERRRRMSETLLRDAAELPDLDGDRLVIVWDFEEVDEEQWTILRHGDREIWRERAYWDGIGRLAEVVEILRVRYGARLVEVRPTPASELWLCGDKLRAGEMLDDINASLRVQD